MDRLIANLRRYQLQRSELRTSQLRRYQLRVFRSICSSSARTPCSGLGRSPSCLSGAGCSTVPAKGAGERITENTLIRVAESAARFRLSLAVRFCPGGGFVVAAARVPAGSVAHLRLAGPGIGGARGRRGGCGGGGGGRCCTCGCCRGGLVVGLRGSGHLLELLADLAGVFAGGCELAGLREWLADAVAGVLDLALGLADAGEGGGLAFFEAGQAVLHPGDQAGGVGFAEFAG